MSDTFRDLSQSNFPDAIDKYRIYQDITLDTAPYIEQIRADIDARKFEDAKAIMTAHPELENIMATAVLFQRFEDQIIAIERTWASSIYDKVTHVVKYKGDYSNTATYQMFNVVNYNNKSYQCISTDEITGILPTNTNNWQLLTIQGVSGTGMAFYTTWSSTQEYKVQDCVPYGNKLYVCITANTNQTPSTSPDYWKQVIVVPRQIIWSKNQPESQEEGDVWEKVNDTDSSYETYVCQGNNEYILKQPKSNANFISTSDGSTVQEKLDEDDKISTYIHTYDSATKIHNLQGNGSNIKFLATADYHEGDTWTLNGNSVNVSTQDNQVLSIQNQDICLAIAGNTDLVFINRLTPIMPTALKNPKQLRVYYGYDSGQHDYDGSAEVRINIPKFTFHTSAPTSTIADGEIWCVY